MASDTVHDLRDRLAGAVWGHLVGDAIGVPYEFLPPEAIGTVWWGQARTHPHPRSQAACAVYCLVVGRLVLGADDREEALGLALIDASTNLPEHARSELHEVRSYSSCGGTGYVLDTLWSAWDAFAAGTSYV